MINKISNLTPKKLFPFVAAGLMTLTSCATIQQIKTREYCLGTGRSQAEYEEVMSKLGDTKADNQARLDSLAYRDIFNGTRLANDSAAVADFNKIYQNRYTTENFANFLKENNIDVENYEYIMHSKISDAKKQFEADYFLYNKFFEKHGLYSLDMKDKIERAAFFLYPPHQYYYDEIFTPCSNGSCKAK